MRRKSVRRLSSVIRPPKTATATVRRFLPLVGHSQDVNNAAVPETYSDTDDDLEDGRVAGSNDKMADCMKQHSNGSPVEISSHDYLCIDILDRKICLGCNEGGEVLVCSEIGCPISLHSKCIGSEPSFDNMGNFYCPYCQYKRAVAKVKELKNKARIETKALSKFLGKNVVTGDKATPKNGNVKRAEHKEVPHTGVEDILDGCNRKGSGDVQSQPLLRKGDQEREMDRTAACADQPQTAIEGEVHAKTSVNNMSEFKCHAKEETPIRTELVQNPLNREIFDDIMISQTDETRFAKVKERIETEDPRHNDEDLHETSGENRVEEEPLNASPLRVYTPDIALAKGRQESVAVPTESKGGMKDIEQMLQKESRVPATDRSVSEIINSYSYSGGLSVRKGRFKQRANRTAYPQTVDSDRESPQKNNTSGTNACYQNVKVTPSRKLRQPQGSSKQFTRETLLHAKRRRLRWTTEEENMLKEGVSRFSMENHNIPWRRILEYGSNVFDSTRTPVDLKDKWKNITAKKGINALLDRKELVPVD